MQYPTLWPYQLFKLLAMSLGWQFADTWTSTWTSLKGQPRPPASLYNLATNLKPSWLILTPEKTAHSGLITFCCCILRISSLAGSVVKVVLVITYPRIGCTYLLVPPLALGDFRIWTRFLRRCVYFRVISDYFNPYCMHAHWMITTDLLHAHMETIVATSGVLNDIRPRLVERWTIVHKSYSLLDLRDCSAVLQCLLMPDHPAFSSQSTCFQVTPSINL